MNFTDITIRTHVLKKGKFDQQSFRSQIITIGNTRTCLLDVTKRDLLHKACTITPECIIYDNGKVYYVKEIWYWPRSKQVFLNVYV